ncbi:MAG TPA: endonuclease III [Candidatus Acidoferrales bacterium]|nr:endonuclease III [Candidatus Acidoferrales bacterium]
MNDPVIPFPTRKVPVAVARRELEILEKTYPNAVTALDYDSPFTLLIAVMLSAQTTDVRVNLITPFLFAKYPDAASLARADVADVETIIKSSGFFRTKARNIIRTAQELVERYHGEVPQEREALEALPGVGRKTASVVVSVAFAGAALAVDTHVFRVSHRLGLTLGTTPREVEDDVTKLVSSEKLRHAHHWLILHGRQICKAPIPLCDRCPVAKLCPSAPIVARFLRAKAKKLKSAAAPARRDAPAAAARRPARSASAKKKR